MLFLQENVKCEKHRLSGSIEHVWFTVKYLPVLVVCNFGYWGMIMN